MKKMNNKGQVLIETLVTSVMIVGVLVYLFIQLRSVSNNYNKTVHYNSINALYAADNFRTFIMNENYMGASGAGDTDGLVAYYRRVATTSHYIDITNCCINNSCEGTDGSMATNGIVNVSYCQALVSDLKIKQILMTMEDTSSLVGTIDNVSTDAIDVNFKSFIKFQKSDKESNVYRIFIETTGGDFSSVKLKK